MKKLFLFIFLFISIPAFAQTSIGIEAQAYPAGFIYGLRIDLEVKEDLSLISKFAYNYADRKDWGVNDNEEGDGVGFSLGVEKNNLFLRNLSLQLRSDLWFMDIDWSDLELQPGQSCLGNLIGSPCYVFSSGTTEITVLQPTIGLGYLIPFKSRAFIKPNLSFGYEINIATDGESVGEGAILLAGFQFGFRL